MNTLLFLWGTTSGILFIGGVIAALITSDFDEFGKLILASLVSMLLWAFTVFISKKRFKTDMAETVAVESVPHVTEIKASTDTIEISAKNYIQKLKIVTFDDEADTILVFIKK